MMFFLFLISILLETSWADSFTDLERHASQVPIAEITEEVIYYIENETNESLEDLQAHYTLALYENLQNGRSWYILDGYYQLQSGKLLFLDFIYRPRDKQWWPIKNYQYYVPKIAERFLLVAEEICNPYKRNFFGVLRTGIIPIESLAKIEKFFQAEYSYSPIFVYDNGQLTIIDPTKSTRMSSEVKFSLQEEKLQSQLLAIGVKSEILTSGREPSNDRVRKTYVGVTNSCR